MKSTTGLERLLMVLVLLICVVFLVITLSRIEKTCGVVLYEDGTWVAVDEPARTNFTRGLPPGCQLVIEK